MSYGYSDEGFGSGLYSAEDTEASTAISVWNYTIDGHQFIFINLGSQGTFIYDMTAGTWLSWSRGGAVDLGFTDGQIFYEFCLMGSQENGDIFTFDYDSLDDYSGGFDAEITSGMTARSRKNVGCYGIHLSGNTSETDGRSVKLYYSDDNGVTWNYAGENNPVDQTDEVSWRSLGVIKYPGRVFRVVDDGAMKSFDGMEMLGDSGGS